MRRANREIPDPAEILAVIDRCDVCRLALSRDGYPYIVPMNFGYEYAGGRLALYFHCAKEGQKLDIIRANPNACFEMDCACELIEGETACGYGMRYESVVGFGGIALANDISAKEKALRLLMRKYAPEKVFTFSEQQLVSVTVLRLEAESFTGKRHK